MAGRQRYSLDHKAIQTLRIGRLTTLARIPVIAGDSIGLRSQIFIRMNNLRRPVPFDVRVDVFGFFVPYRFTYPTLYQAFDDMRNANAGEAPHVNINNAGVQAVLLNNAAGDSVMEHVLDDYVNIWNHYFRDPHASDMAQADLNPAANADAAGMMTPRFGKLCSPLKTLHTTTLQGDGVADVEIPITVEDAAQNEYSLDVSQIPRKMAEWRDDQWRAWTAVRFEDAHKQFFGVDAPASTVTRPYYLGCRKRWMSSTDIDGTAGDQFGSVVGKLVGGAHYSIPRRLMREHGTIWVMMLLRPSPVFTYAKHYLDNPAYFRDYKKMWSVPSAQIELPIQVKMDDLFWQAPANTNLGWIPFNQWYRTHVSFASALLSEEDQGWEGRPTPASGGASILCSDYDDVFNTLAGGHGKAFALTNCRVARRVGDVMTSVAPRP